MEQLRELYPNGIQRSFYGKAFVKETDSGEILYSYGTPIMKRTCGKTVRLWNGWSNTTGRHIKAFCGMNKKEFNQLPYREPTREERSFFVKATPRWHCVAVC